MSPFFPSRPRIRALFLTAISVVLVTISLAWASRQQAGSPSSKSAFQHSSPPLFADQGGITPAVATITVNSLSDVANGSDGLCTLREAITAANSNTASGATAGECAAGSGSGSDAINFTVTGTINLNGALPDISSDMTITGPGSAQLTVKRNTSDFYRIFNIASGVVALSGVTVTSGRAPDTSSGGGIQNLGTLNLSDVVVSSNGTGIGSFFGGSAGGGGIGNQGTLTLTNCSVTGNNTANATSGGASPEPGGGIYNSGTLTMTNCVVSGNRTGDGSNTGGLGGGIYNSGPTMTLVSSSISNNVTGNGTTNLGGHGGGIYNVAFNSATVLNCTINGNSTGTTPSGSRGFGAGIDHQSGGLVIIGTTISGNSGSSGGGILNRAQVNLINSTISGNSLDGVNSSDTGSFSVMTNCTVTGNGTGVISSGTPSVFRNTIVAGNVFDASGLCTSQGHNLIGVSGGSFVNGVNGDQVGTSGSPLNAQLGSLANNGGPTLTHALLSNSTALDAGDNCVTDAAHCGDANISQLTNDQRGAGFSRQVDGPDVDTTATVDIGAYEMQTPLANLADTSTNEDTQLLVPFDGGDTSTITSVTATSSNATLVPNDVAHLSVTVTGSTGIVTIIRRRI